MKAQNNQVFETPFSDLEKHFITTESVPLSLLVRQFRCGKIQVPEHQRTKIWPRWKRDSYLRDVITGNMAPQLFAIYTLIGNSGANGSPFYLNDGYQRLSTLVEYISSQSEEDAEHFINSVLEDRTISRCRHEYTNHEQAVYDFIKLQVGESCTPYEQLRGLICYIKDYETVWKERIEKLHQVVSEYQVLTSKKSNVRKNRKENHKFKRDDYALFVRFVSGDTRMSTYDSGRSQELPIDKLLSNKTVEYEFRQIINRLSAEEFDELFESFVRLLKTKSVVIQEIWHKYIDDKPGSGPTPTLYRWLIAVAIYAKNNKVSPSYLYEFIKTLLIHNKGETLVYHPGDRSNNRAVSTGLSKLDALKRICRYIDFDINDEPKRKHQSRSTTGDGWDLSHPPESPFAIDGDKSDVVLSRKSTTRNRSRIDDLIATQQKIEAEKVSP